MRDPTEARKKSSSGNTGGPGETRGVAHEKTQDLTPPVKSEGLSNGRREKLHPRSGAITDYAKCSGPPRRPEAIVVRRRTLREEN